jgi:hypothetical protein
LVNSLHGDEPLSPVIGYVMDLWQCLSNAAAEVKQSAHNAGVNSSAVFGVVQDIR